MSSRRFTARCLRASTEKDSTTGGSAAVRKSQSGLCPLWVKSGQSVIKERCPLYPESEHSIDARNPKTPVCIFRELSACCTLSRHGNSGYPKFC